MLYVITETFIMFVIFYGLSTSLNHLSLSPLAQLAASSNIFFPLSIRILCFRFLSISVPRRSVSLPFVKHVEKFCMWIIVKREISPSKHSQRFAIFFCADFSLSRLWSLFFIFASIHPRTHTHKTRYFNELHLFFMLSFIHFFLY